jgi:predicted phosphate transport protein (TIGR00153 family)
MKRLLEMFSTKDKKFFPLFEKASHNLVKAAKTMNEMVNTTSLEKRKELLKEIENLEHVGDSHTHQMFHELNVNFITPFDREDIHDLATALDDIVDYIWGSAKRMDLYKITEYSPAMIKLVELNMQCAEEIYKAIGQLHNLKNTDIIKEACVRINSIENHADDVFENAIARLFEENTNPLEIIKVKEILSILETATDKCEDVADVIKTILVKNS